MTQRIFDADGTMHLDLPARFNLEDLQVENYRAKRANTATKTDIHMIQSEISQLKLVISTLICWISGSAASPISLKEANDLLKMIAVFDKPPAVDAVDPHVSSTGTPTTLDNA